MKKMMLAYAAVLAVSFLLPAAAIWLWGEEVKPPSSQPEPNVTVTRSGQNKTETVALESYVAGVVAGEMPASFEQEALKAQSVAARTFLQSRGMTVTDTVEDQVYKNDEELQQQWGDAYEANKKKIEAAVAATAGEVLTYEGALITAAFFSSGNGQTENAEDYWQSETPYLISVASPWDQEAPNFEQKKELPKQEAEQKLGVSLPDEGEAGTVLSRTEGGRVKEIQIGGKTFTGRDIRETLGLPSADFTLAIENGKLTAYTKGYGHGVGMSQYGANGMAKEGYTYKEILTHFYPGTELTKKSP